MNESFTAAFLWNLCFFFKVANDVGRVSEYFQELLNCLERGKKIGAYDCCPECPLQIFQI